jgi:hypothetical protein
MSYDSVETRALLKVAGAYQGTPMGEYIGKLATQLIDADAEIRAANDRASKAERDLIRAEEERDSAMLKMRQLRDPQPPAPAPVEETSQPAEEIASP